MTFVTIARNGVKHRKISPITTGALPRGRISQTPGISRSRVTLMVSQRSAKCAQAGDAPVMRGNSGRSAGTCFINSSHYRKSAGWEYAGPYR